MDAEVLPEIRDFVGDCVDDVGDFVADDEFDVLAFGVEYLGGKLVAHEESVLDFDGS